MKYAVKSHKGMIRETNEDGFNIVTGDDGIPVALIIADGMGGHNSGEIASKMAVDFISHEILDINSCAYDTDKMLKFIENLMEGANAHVYSASSQQGMNFGMGTTLISAVAFENRMFIGHVGDSRVYLLRNGILSKITVDHSLVEELVKEGSLSRAEALNHPQRNVITRAIGCTPKVQIDTYTCGIDDRDTFVLCTDGLTNMVSDEEIKTIIENASSPEAACEELVNRANCNGGEDNITVIILRKY